jgi:primosomal protein N'
MKLVEVILLATYSHEAFLSYYSLNPLSVGDIVSVPYGKRFVRALVMHVSDASHHKTDIKSASFRMKPVKEVLAQGALPIPFFGMLMSLSTATRTNPAVCTGLFLAESVLEYRIEHPASHMTHALASELEPDTLVLQKNFQERIGMYRTLIREYFARKQSIHFFVPTQEEAEILGAELARTAEERLYILHGGLTKKKQQKTLEALHAVTTPCIVISTPAFVCADGPETTLGIIEYEGSPYYTSRHTKHITLSWGIELYTRKQKRACILAGTLLSSETRKRLEEGVLQPYSYVSYHIHQTLDIVHSYDRPEIPPEQEKTFSYIPEALVKEIEHGIHKRIAIIGGRLGYATLMLCQDCGTVVTCTQCHHPITLHKKNKQQETSALYGMCHRCLMVHENISACTTCGGWRLAPFGRGIEKIQEILQEHFPRHTLMYQLHEQSRKEQEVFTHAWLGEKTEPLIVLGTQRTLEILPKESASLLVLMNIDTLSSLPLTSAYEHTSRMLMHACEKVHDTLWCVTHHEKNMFVQALKNKTFIEILETDMHMRETYHFPPALRILKMVVLIPKQEASRHAETIAGRVEAYNPDVFLVPEKGNPEMIAVHMIIKIPRTLWRWDTDQYDESLRKELAALGHLYPEGQWFIDPEQLL